MTIQPQNAMQRFNSHYANLQRAIVHDLNLTPQARQRMLGELLHIGLAADCLNGMQRPVIVQRPAGWLARFRPLFGVRV